MHDLFLVVFAISNCADPLPETQDRDPVGALEDVVEVVGDDDHPEAPLREPANQIEHLPRLRDAERGGGLVEDHELASST